MTNYYRVMPGRGRVYASECLVEGFIGGDWNAEEDLTGQLPDDWKQFNKAFIPKFLQANPGKSRIAAGLAGGMLWTISKGLLQGDVVVIPDLQNQIHFGRITSDYFYVAEGPLQHRRKVSWLPITVHRHSLSEELQSTLGAIGTVANVTRFAAEIEGIIGGKAASVLAAADEEVEDPSAFALEKHLEDFLVANWAATDLGKTHRIFEEDGEKRGQQYPTDTGPIDILAISQDSTELLVIELKRGRASDAVVGQIQRYMGYVKEELAESGQSVRGVIIALDDDVRIRRALSVASNIDFYRYEVNFKLHKA